MEIPCPRSRSTATIRRALACLLACLLASPRCRRRLLLLPPALTGHPRCVPSTALVSFLPHPPARRVEMRDESRLLFSDEFSLSFHIHFYRLLKWLVAAPFAAASLALLAWHPEREGLLE